MISYGKVAYAQYIGEDPEGLVGFVGISSVTVMNMITDEIIDTLYTQLYRLGGGGYENDIVLYGLNGRIIRRINGGNENGISFERFWNVFEREITNMLRIHAIVSSPDFEYNNMDALRTTYGLEVSFMPSATADESGKYKDTIIVRNRNGRAKTIGQCGLFFESDGFCEYRYRGRALGFYKSPFENRGMIIWHICFSVVI